MPVRFGPVGLSPTLAIANFGTDSNVFNAAEDPQSDFTLTAVPRLQARLRARRALLWGSVATSFVYFREFEDERSIDFTTDARADFNLGWLRPYASATWLNTHERLNAEIDARAPRTDSALAAGTGMRFSPKTGLVFNVRRATLDFAEGATFDGIPLARTMNSTNDVVEGGLEIFLTPLTTFTVTATFERDRFDESPDRDADRLRILPSVRFQAPAIVQGTFSVGYERFEPLSPLLRPYTGVVARASLASTLAEKTRFELSLARDVQYSFEVVEPYYVATAYRLTVTYQIHETLDVRGTGGQERMAYRAVEVPGGQPFDDTRDDRADVVGAGIGYWLRSNIRIGVDVEYARRHSVRVDRRYDRTRVFGSLTYGL